MTAPRLSPAAQAVFKKANLDIKPDDAAKVDRNGDSTIDAGEAKALVRVIDRDDNGTIDDKEQKALDHFVGRDQTLEGAEAWLESRKGYHDPHSGVRQELHAAESAKWDADRALSSAKHEKTMAESAAKREMGYTTPEPKASAEQLKAEHQQTGSSQELKGEIAHRQSALSKDKAELAQLHESNPKLRARVDRLDRKGFDEELSRAEGKLAKYERLYAKMPTKKARDAHVDDLNQQRAEVKAEVKELKKVRPRSSVADKIEALEAKDASLYRERREAETFYPAGAERKIKHYSKKVGDLREDIAQRDSLRDQLETNTARASTLGKDIADNTAGLAEAQSKLGRAELLEKQIPFAEVRDAHQAKVAAAERDVGQAKARIGALQEESTNVKALMDQAQSVTSGARSTVSTKRNIDRLTKSLEAEQKSVANSPFYKDKATQLAKAQAIKGMVERGELNADDVDMTKVNADIASAKKTLNAAAARIEKKAKALSDALEDPATQEQLSKMTESERAGFEPAAHAALAPTEAGRAFYEKNVKPVLTGSPKASPFWKDAFSVVNKSQSTPLKFIESYGRFIAAEGGSKSIKLLDSAMAQSLGLNRAEMKKVQQALDMVSEDGKKGMAEAQEWLKGQGGKLAGMADKLDRVGKTFGAVSGVIATAELFRDPSLKKSLEAASNAGDMAAVANLIKNNKALTNFSKVAGKFAPPLNAVLGTWNAIDAHNRGDTGAAVGNGMQGIGGAMAMIGAGMSATGIGAAAGVPLAIAGGIVGGIGTVVDWIWGDSKTEAFLREHAPEYMD